MSAAASGTFYGQAMTAGDICTIAGTGTAGLSGDGGPATAAELINPQAVALDGSGDVLIDDTGSNRIRVVAVGTGTFYGKAMTAATSTRSPAPAPRGSPVTRPGHRGGTQRAVRRGGGRAGDVLITDTGDNRIRWWRPAPARLRRR